MSETSRVDIRVEEALPLLLEASVAPVPLGRLREIVESAPALATGSVMRVRAEEWRQATRGLSTAELFDLIRLLALAEAHLPGWGAGSVSPVIWLFRTWAGQDGVEADSLADWILGHSTNDYLPYGTSNLGANSLADLARRREVEAKRKADGARAESARCEDARLRRADEATKKVFAAVRRGDVAAVQALVEQGANLASRDEQGRTPLDYALETRRDAIASLLRSTPDG